MRDAVVVVVVVSVVMQAKARKLVVAGWFRGTRGALI
jgi:hypothetical protein